MHAIILSVVTEYIYSFIVKNLSKSWSESVWNTGFSVPTIAVFVRNFSGIKMCLTVTLLVSVR